MKKLTVYIAALLFIGAMFSSCRSAKPSCAAYDQVQELEVAK